MDLRLHRALCRLVVVAGVLAACDAGSEIEPSDSGDNFDSAGGGATPGGVKDLRLAREIIASGRVPPPDALLVEAMFAEHDLPVDGPECAQTLCLRAAAGVAPEIAGDARGWAQVGLSSSIGGDWRRPSTTFIFTVDVSGSMGWEYLRGDTPGALSRTLLHQLTDQLRPDDAVAIVTYGSSIETRLGLTSGAEPAQVHAVIDELREAGSTNMEGGLRRAFDIASAATATEQVRVVLFTDVQPNVGATQPSQFEKMVTAAAANDVSITVLALGLGIGPAVFRSMAAVRGANAYSLIDGDDVSEFMTDNYPWFTTPIAYRLRVTPVVDGGWGIDRGLGFPAADDASQIGLKAESVFVSNNRGALLVALRPPADDWSALAGQFRLDYEARDGDPVSETASFSVDRTGVNERGHWFAQAGVARTTALALFTEGMHDAAAAYADNPAGAEAIMRAAQARFQADAAALASDDLPAEVELGAAMLRLIETRAPQQSFYGETY